MFIPDDREYANADPQTIYVSMPKQIVEKYGEQSKREVFKNFAYKIAELLENQERPITFEPIQSHESHDQFIGQPLIVYTMKFRYIIYEKVYFHKGLPELEKKRGFLDRLVYLFTGK